MDPRSIAIWALPTAIAAFVIHALRIAWFQRGIAKAVRTGDRGLAAIRRHEQIAQDETDAAH
jgi:hypothetical protein